jgi:hypothetical protein
MGRLALGWGKRVWLFAGGLLLSIPHHPCPLAALRPALTRPVRLPRARLRLRHGDVLAVPRL